MLMMGNKEKAVGLILKGLGNKEASPSAPSNTESDYGEGYKMAAQDLLSAIESKDAGRVAASLKAFVQMCDIEPSEGE